MAQFVDGRTWVVWLGLVGLTVVSWQVSTHGPNAQVATTLVMAVAFVKIRFIGSYFMDLRCAPLPLKLIFDAYCVAVGGAVIGLYLAG